MLDEEFHEAAELFNRVEGVEVKSVVLQGTPERLDHRVGVGNVDLCENALQAGTEQGGVYRAVDILDAVISRTSPIGLPKPQ